MSSVKQYFLGFGLIIVSLVVALITFFYLALSPQLKAKQTLIEVAKSEQLQPNQDFKTFTGQESFYVLSAQDDDNKTQYLLMSADSQVVHIQAADEGLTEEDIQAKAAEAGVDVDRVTLGYYDDKLVWEIKSQSQYYLYDFKTGDLIRRLG